MKKTEISAQGDQMQTYFDNASTSYPKPPEMLAALCHFYDEPVGSYGRDGSRGTLIAGSRIEEVRDSLSQRLGIASADHLCFADNATTGLNTILQGIDWQQDDVVYLSPLEHNAVMRPLHYLAQRHGIRLQQMPCQPSGRVDTDRLVACMPERTRLIVLNMESNVNGLMQPVEEVCSLLRSERGIPILLDTTQWLVAGRTLATDDLDVDYLAFTGHKGLLGPTGTGGFFIRNPQTVRPLKYGGTGVKSIDLTPSPHMPDRYTAGTLDSLSLVGLWAAVKYGPQAYQVEQRDFCLFLRQLAAIPGLRLYAADRDSDQGYIASMVHERISPNKIADALYQSHGIVCRHGLHCAPTAHLNIGTIKTGTLRLSISPYHTTADLDYFLSSLTNVLK